jgi:predicted RNase H-like HicB family nuclease
MQTKVMNYRIIIDSEKTGRNTVFNAYCPILGIADYGDSIDEAIKNIKSLIKFHVESLLQEGLEVPLENTEEELIASTKVLIKQSANNFQVALA